MDAQKTTPLLPQQKEQAQLLMDYIKQTQGVDLTQAFKVLSDLQKKIAEMSKTVSELKEEAKVYSLHLSKMYEAKTVEETLKIMSDLGNEILSTDNCTVFCVDPRNSNRVFFMDEDDRRKYVELDSSSAIGKAIDSKEVLIDNEFDGENIGDSIYTQGVKNTMVVPLENRSGEVICAVVARNKEQGSAPFTAKDAKLFDLESGQLGNTFRMCLENKTLKAKVQTNEVSQYPNIEAMKEFVKDTVLNRASANQPVTALFIDIDRFKHLNDLYGHQVGDRAIRHVCETLSGNLRTDSNSCVFHLHGEEIAVLLPTDEATGFDIAERCRHAIEETPMIINKKTGESVSMTVSIGVAEYKPKYPHQLTKSDVFEDFEKKCVNVADQNTLLAKENGRNQVMGSYELMKIKHSAPSPTVTFKEFTDYAGFNLSYNKDGYILSDRMSNNEVLRKDMQTINEVVEAINSAGGFSFLCNDLNSNLRQYCYRECGYENENLYFPDTLQAWCEHTEALAKEPFYKAFLEENEGLLRMVDVLTSHTDEIRFTYIAQNLDRDVERNMDNSVQQTRLEKRKQIERND